MFIADPLNAPRERRLKRSWPRRGERANARSKTGRHGSVFSRRLTSKRLCRNVRGMRALPCRIAILAAAALLGACVAHHPRPSASASPKFVLPPHRPGGPNANDVLFRAIGLVGTPYRY